MLFDCESLQRIIKKLVEVMVDFMGNNLFLFKAKLLVGFVLFFGFISTSAFAQSSELNQENTITQSPPLSFEQNLNVPVIRILPDLIFNDIVTENKTELEIIEIKIQRIETAKKDINEIFADQELELQRIQQLDQIKFDLNDRKNKILNIPGEKKN